MIWGLIVGIVIGFVISAIFACRMQKHACKCLEGIRQDEETVLKTVGCNSLAGSSPAPSALTKGDDMVEETGTPREFELYKDASGEFRWRLRAANGRIIATSNDGYANKADAEHAIKLVKNATSATTVQDLT